MDILKKRRQSSESSEKNYFNSQSRVVNCGLIFLSVVELSKHQKKEFASRFRFKESG